MKNKRRKNQVAHKQAKKFRSNSVDDDFINIEPEHSDSRSDNDSDNYFEKEDEFEDDAEEILPITNDDTSDDDEIDVETYDDNIENKNASDDFSSNEEDEDAGPIEAWGKKKRNFYSTDFVDEDRGKSYREEDLENAKAEENDALAIHRNFLSDIYSSASHITSKSEFVMDKEATKDHFETTHPDWKSISKKDKLYLIQKQNPEFLPTVQCFKNKLSELQNQILPLVRLLKSMEETAAEPYTEYINLKHQLLLHYCMNASFYMTLRYLNVPSTHHPVVKRLNDFKILLDRFQGLDTILKSSIDEILGSMKEQSNSTQTLLNKVLKIKKTSEIKEHEDTSDAKIKSSTEKNKTPKKKVHFETETEKEISDQYIKMKELQKQGTKQHSEESDNETEATDNEDNDKQNENDEISKRTISYQIAKNKGLTPRRKKEYRNPRVKHRMKFKKAQVRRKGQVRLPRKEMKKYGGEVSGISSHVSKSVKIK